MLGRGGGVVCPKGRDEAVMNSDVGVMRLR